LAAPAGDVTAVAPERARLVPRWAVVYVAWAILAITLAFVHSGWTPDNITHGSILLYLGGVLLAQRRMRRPDRRAAPRVFVSLALVSAAFVEGAYMISGPVFHSLLVTPAMPFAQAVRNYAIDLTYTLPVYFTVFVVMWRIAARYEYNAWEFTVLASIGQCLGDANHYFLANPGLLLFAPYVLINYHAMNCAPYLLAQDALREPPRHRTAMRFVAPVVLILLVYLIGGFILFGIAAKFGFKA
jgi:hypothetical protein